MVSHRKTKKTPLETLPPCEGGTPPCISCPRRDECTHAAEVLVSDAEARKKAKRLGA